MVRLFIPLLLALLFLSSCGGEKVVSLTAAGLKEPFLRVVELYKREHPQREVDTVFAGSGSLLVKLENHLGDLYIPASYSYIEEAVRKGLVDPQTVKILAYHKPVLLVRKPFAGEIKSIYDLARVNLRIGISDPREAAIGRVTYEILRKAGLWNELQKKIVVRTPTVNQLLLYLKSGDIDAAFVWEELADKVPNAVKVKIPPSLVEREPIPVGVTTFTKHRKEALDFENFLLRHREIFRQFGFH